MKFLIILFALALLVFLIIRPFVQIISRSGGNIKSRKKAPDNIEEMCQCAHCGVYVSSSESLISNGLYFCSKDCLKNGEKR